MRKPRIGIVCLSRKTFDYVTAYKIYLERVEEIIKDTNNKQNDIPTTISNCLLKLYFFSFMIIYTHIHKQLQFLY